MVVAEQRGTERSGAQWRARWRRILARWARHPVLVAAAIYALLSVVMVGQGLLPGRTLSGSDYLWSAAPWTSSAPRGVPLPGTNIEIADSVDQIQAFLGYSRSTLPHVPLWNPYIMAGRPFLADAQSAVFAPFNAPAYVLPFWKSLAVVAALKLFVAAFGTFLLARALAIRFGGALFAGVVFAFGTFFIVWLGWPLASVFALIPWVLLMTELVLREPGPLPLVGLAVVVALQFLGGHPESSFHLLFTAVVFFVFRALLAWWRRPREPRHLLRPTMTFVLGLAAGAALAALVLIPFIELLAHSSDLHTRLHLAPDHADSKYLPALFLHDYWGRPTQSTIEPFMSNRGWYAGALTLMLAAAALIVRPAIERVAVALYGLFCLLMVVGNNIVFHAMTHLPGFRTSHNGRMVIYFLLSLALLAGWGLDDLSRREAIRKRRRLLVVGCSAVLCAPILYMLERGTLDLHQFTPALKVAWGFQHPPPLPLLSRSGGGSVAGIIRLSSLLEWLVLAGAGFVLVALRLRARHRLVAGAFVALAVALVAADLFRANMGFNPAIPISHAVQPATNSIRYLQAQRPARFVGLTPKKTLLPVAPLAANEAMRFRLYDARGYDYPVVSRLDRFWSTQVAFGGYIVPSETLADATPKALRALGLLGVTDLLQFPGDDPLHLPQVRLLYAGRDARIYRNQLALPRAFLVDRLVAVRGGKAALAAVSNPTFDLRTTAVTERPIAGLSHGASPAGTARIQSYAPERVTLAASARRRSMLVLTDTFFPGWTATVDGRGARIEQVDYLLRGVVVAAGTHRVEFRYQPLSWRIGWIVSALTVIVLGALTVVGLRARRRPLRTA